MAWKKSGPKKTYSEDSLYDYAVFMLGRRMRTVAEGVESKEEAFYLRAVGVDYGQGYFWSRAIPAAQMSALLEHGFAATLEWPGTD